MYPCHLVTLPLSSYTDGLVVSLNLLHTRLKCCGSLPSGMIFLLSYSKLLQFLLLGWNNAMQNEGLLFYQLCSLGGSPDIGKSITDREDFTWNVNYRRQLVNPEYCSILKSISPKVLYTVYVILIVICCTFTLI